MPSSPPSFFKGPHQRRAVRAVVFRRIKGVYLKCPKLADREFKIHAISEFGLGIERLIPPPVQANALFDGTLRVGMSVTSVRLRYASATPSVLGFEFIQPSDLLRNAIRTYFEAELTGAGLALDPKDPATRVLGKSYDLLLRDAQGRYLQVVVKDERMSAFRLHALNATLEWTRKEGFKPPLADDLRKNCLALCQNLHALEAPLRDALEAAFSLLQVP